MLVNAYIHTLSQICSPSKKKKKKCVHIDFRQAIVQALVESATDAPRPQKKGQKSAEMLGWLTDISLDISK